MQEKKILELGSNVGHNTFVIACLIGHKNCHNIVALNSSTEYTQICKHNLISRGFDNVKVINRAISKIPLGNATFMGYFPIQRAFTSKS